MEEAARKTLTVLLGGWSRLTRPTDDIKEDLK